MGSVAVAWTALIVATLLCALAMGAGRRVLAESESYDAHGLADEINRIIEIESHGNPLARGRAGEVGLMQIREATWKEVCRLIGADWPFEDAENPFRNIMVGTTYWRDVIPGYLKAYRLPDNPYMRLAAYNWGIGNLRKHFRKYGLNGWFDALPPQVKGYCLRWQNAKPANYIGIFLKGLADALEESGPGLHRPSGRPQVQEEHRQVQH